MERLRPHMGQFNRGVKGKKESLDKPFFLVDQYIEYIMYDVWTAIFGTGAAFFSLGESSIIRSSI